LPKIAVLGLADGVYPLIYVKTPLINVKNVLIDSDYALINVIIGVYESIIGDSYLTNGVYGEDFAKN
jgi:hypothetical protein